MFDLARGMGHLGFPVCLTFITYPSAWDSPIFFTRTWEWNVDTSARISRFYIKKKYNRVNLALRNPLTTPHKPVILYQRGPKNNPLAEFLRDNNNNDKNQWDLLNVSLLNIVVLLSPKSTFHVCRAINFYAIVCFCCSPTVIRWNQLHVFNVGESALKSPIRLHSNRLIRRTSTFWTYPTANLASIFQLLRLLKHLVLYINPLQVGVTISSTPHFRLFLSLRIPSTNAILPFPPKLNNNCVGEL